MDHENTLVSKLLDKIIDIECFFSLHSLYHAVQDNESACSAHPSTAVDKQRTGVRVEMELADTPDEVEHHCTVVRHSMIRPGDKMKLDNLKRRGLWLRGLRKIERKLKSANTKINVFYLL